MGPLRWFADLLYGAEPHTFVSRLTLADAVAGLAAVVESSRIDAMKKECAVGTVSAGTVLIRRSIPWVRNSWKPVFSGRFTHADGRTVLAGVFTMAPVVKGLLTVWFAFIGVWTVAVAWLTVSDPRAPGLAPLVGVALFCAGAGMVRLGKWFARNDVAWLSRLIEAALEVRTKDGAGRDAA